MQQPVTASKTRVLIVDDDPIVLRIYQNGLTSCGFQVETATDGVLAVKAMRASRPDVVVLDLMMPRLSGGDVLKFMRETPALEKIPVIVLSNAYIGVGADDPTAQGARARLLKVQCTPSILRQTIWEVLDEVPGTRKPPPATIQPATDPKPKQSSRAEPARPVQIKPVPAAPTESPTSDTEVRLSVRAQFLANADAICSGLHAAFIAFGKTTQLKEREIRLQDLYRRVHLLTSSAGLAECNRLAQLATAFEALLFRIMDDPTRLTASCLCTMEKAIDFVQALFREAQAGCLGTFVKGEALVVDDDPASNRLANWGLKQAGLRSRSTEDPAVGLKLLSGKKYDLILLDVEMPEINGFEFYKRARALPGYERTPVIFVTAHSDFETRAKSVAVGANDLIGKPVNAMELAVKVTMHLLSAHAPGKTSA